MISIPLSQSTFPGEGFDAFRLVVESAAAVPQRALSPHRTSAHCFVFYSTVLCKAVVVMVDGKYGASITNSAEWLTSYIYRLYIARRGLNLDNVRWVYRDTEGAWDELVVKAAPHAVAMTDVSFRPLTPRTFDAAMATLIEVGLHPVKTDFARVVDACEGTIGS